MRIDYLCSKIPVADKVRKDFLLCRSESKIAPLQSDTVNLSPEAKIQIQANRILSGIKKFDISSYNSLSRLEKAILRQASTDYKKSAEDSILVGLNVKKQLDTYYGDGKYVFCSIGTSMSGIGRVLEFSGVETKYLPMSKLNILCFDNQDAWKDCKASFPAYQEFMNEQGLSPEEVASSGKYYLFYDYVQSGLTLNAFKDMMKSDFGLDLPNVEFHSGNFLCYSACAEKIDPPQYAIDYVKEYLEKCHVEMIGGVPHLPVKELEKIGECKNYENDEAKKYNFLVIDKLAERGLLKHNPNNDTSL